MSNNHRLQAALQLAARGRFIFPADKNKKPIIKDWPNNATLDTAILKAWFERQPYNLAVVTGNKSGFFCLDIDGETGKDSLLALEKQYGAISAETLCMASTPSNGLHYYFKMPADLDLRNSTGKLGKALEAECTKVFQAVKGTRNNTLNRSAFNVFRLVAGGEISADDAENELKVAAASCGLENKEITLTISSAQAEAFKSPKSAPTRQTQGAKTDRHAQVKPGGLPEPPLEVFPARIRQMLEQAAVAFKYLPPEVPMMALIAFLAACVERSRVVVVKNGWEEAGNLYIGLVAGSGMGKSPCFKAFFKHIWKHEVQNKAKWDLEMDDYNLILEERRKIKNPDELGSLPAKPIRTQYLVEDITLEAIINILAENPRGVLWYSDELSSIVLNFDRYSNAKGGTKAKLLSLYDCAPCKTNRQDKEKDQVIAAATLSIVGTIQPGVLKELFGQMDAISGFLPRFIFILAKRTQPAYLKDIVFTGDELLEKIADRLLGSTNINGDFISRKIPLNRAAYKLYESWHNEHLMKAAFYDSDAIQAIASKLCTQVIRLALLLHCLEAALNDESELTEIAVNTMEKAIKLGDWIMEHQKRIWLALDIEDGPVKTPLEKAIVAVSLGLEDHLVANEWRVSNDDFNAQVCRKMNSKLDSSIIGRTAAKLGIRNIHVRKNRSKEFSEELLKQFKLNYYL